MENDKSAISILANIEKNVEEAKPLRKQVIVCIGEYPIKTLLKQPSINKGTLPIFIEKSRDDIYKWMPKDFNAHFVLGFEDSNIDTHFWYNVLPTISKDNSLIESLKKKPVETAIMFASIWDGVGSASLPTLISKFKASGIDSLSIAILPSKIQPTDAHFNAYGALQLSSAADGATVLLMDRDHLENYEGVDRKGSIIKGNSVSNYLLDLFLAKDLLVEEISELSRSFNIKLFTPIVVTGASYKIYGSLENMLNTALLKPLLTFDLSSASLLYALFRMPSSLKDKLPRTKIELAVTNWFKEKTSLQSIHVTEPVYTEEMSDRIDAVLFIGGFDTTQMFADFETKVKSLKRKAVERGLMTEDWQVLTKIEDEAKNAQIAKIIEPLKNIEEPKEPPNEIQTVEDAKDVNNQEIVEEPKDTQTPVIIDTTENLETEHLEPPKTVNKPKMLLRIKKAFTRKRNKNIKIDEQKEQKTPAA